jgi:hypothetical protein
LSELGLMLIDQVRHIDSTHIDCSDGNFVGSSQIFSKSFLIDFQFLNVHDSEE